MATEADVELGLRVSAGNPGAISVVARLLGTGHAATVRALDQAGILGPAVWVAFKDLGGQDAAKLVELARDIDDLKKRLQELGY